MIKKRTVKAKTMVKKIEILHSNDIHAGFYEGKDNIIISRLSHYIRSKKNENPNTLYCISGDVLCGSDIDTEYKGLSTIDIINSLRPDIFCMGNHELDYGLGQALLLEKCADFPIICSNLYLKQNNRLMFKSHEIIEIDGIRLLFIGVITDDALNNINVEYGGKDIISISDEVDEIEKICDLYKETDIDFTVVLSHLGYERDVDMAKRLSEKNGVDLIIGGHTHTRMDSPTVINNIPIVQLSGGTKKVGKLTINVNTDRNCIDDFEWETVRVLNDKEDDITKERVIKYKKTIKNDSEKLITNLGKEYLIGDRNTENEFLMMLCDSLKAKYDLDIMLFATGSIRAKRLGPYITLGDVHSAFPFDDKLFMVYLTYEQLTEMLHNIIRNVFLGGHREFYEVSSGLTVEYNRLSEEIRVIVDAMDGIGSGLYKTGIQEYHLINSEQCFGVDLSACRCELISPSCTQSVEQALKVFSRDGNLSNRFVVVD